jgi:hypothetical protein
MMEARRNAIPFLIGPVGRWWGNNPKEHRQEEIDIMTYRKDSALFCECKWKNTLVDVDVLNDLKLQSELFAYKRISLWMFSKVGFTDRVKIAAKELKNVRLITLEDMLPLSVKCAT